MSDPTSFMEHSLCKIDIEEVEVQSSLHNASDNSNRIDGPFREVSITESGYVRLQICGRSAVVGRVK